MINRSFGKRRYQSKLKPMTGWPELTALVVIFFIILIFIFVSNSTVRLSGITVQLPKIKTSNMASLEKSIITIAPGASKSLLYFNDKAVTMEELKEKLGEVRNRSRSGTVIIRADRKVPFEEIAEIMALAEKAQLSTFIAVAPANDRGDIIFGQ